VPLPRQSSVLRSDLKYLKYQTVFLHVPNPNGGKAGVQCGKREAVQGVSKNSTKQPERGSQELTASPVQHQSLVSPHLMLSFHATAE